MKLRIAAIAALVVIVAAAGILYLQNESSHWSVPDGYPLPPVPDDNPMSKAKVELGRYLFYDTRLSVNETTSCATCHLQALAFTDGRERSIGATGKMHPRGAMSLVNVAYASRLTWANQMLDSLEVQALTPMFGENPVEMGLAGREAALIETIRRDPEYQARFEAAFPDIADPFTVTSVVRAIATFVRTIVSFDSAYDRYVAGDEQAITDSQVRGMQLFNSERLECFHCHGGFNFTDSSTHANAMVDSVGFHNTGLYNLGPRGEYPPDNTGLYDLTGDPGDMGRFKAPSLRNIAVTAPYMHDGSVASLDEVLDHYRRGGRELIEGPYQGDGRRNPFKSEFVQGFELSAEEKADLIAFLQALTDQSVLTNPELSNPL